MIDRLIEDERGRDRLLAFIARRTLPFRATVADGRPRSTDQNRLMWQWAGEASSQLEDVTSKELQSEWKVRFGVPVLIGEDPKFAIFWASVEQRMPYLLQLELVEFLPVTSLLSVKGFASMLDQIFRHYAERGIELTDPEEGRYGPKIGTGVDRGGTGSGDPFERQAQDRKATGGKV